MLGFVYGCGDAFFFPAYTALIQQIVPPERLQEANALRGIADGFGWFVGPSISGLLVALIGAGGTLGIDAVTFLVSAGYLLTLRVPALLRTTAPATFFAELRDGWREVRSRTWLWVMMLRAMLVLFVTIAPLQVLGPLAITARHQSPALWGLMVGLFSLGMLGGGLIALYYRPRRPMVTVALCGTTASVPMIALALSLSPAGLIAVWFARGVAIGVLDAVWNTTLQRPHRSRLDGPREQLGLDDGRRPVAPGAGARRTDRPAHGRHRRAVAVGGAGAGLLPVGPVREGRVAAAGAAARSRHVGAGADRLTARSRDVGAGMVRPASATL